MKRFKVMAFALVAASTAVASAVRDLCELDDAESFVCSPENPTGKRGGGNAQINAKLRAYIPIKAGETAVLVDMDGPGRIEQMWFGGDIDRNFILRMYWDGEKEPSVEAPLSFFFGGLHFHGDDRGDLRTAEGRYPCYSASMLMVSPALGCNSYFPMPFRRHARVTLENVSTNRTLCTFYAISGSRGEQSVKAGYFHACFREAHPVKKGETFVALDVKGGRGRYVGMTLAVKVATEWYDYQCWVEGEPRIYLDGEETPSLQYTGLEDYFCGSFNFGRDNLLQRYQPYQGLYTGMYAMFGEGVPNRFHLYRFHVADPIRFRNGIRVTLDDMNFWGGKSSPRADSFMTTCYWYEAK